MPSQTFGAFRISEDQRANYNIISTGYEPRKHQQILHRQLKRFNVLVCHRRFGKTVFCLAGEILDRAFRCPLRNPQYAYFAPTYSQAEKVAWQYLKDYTRNIPGVKTNEAKLSITIPRPWADNDRIKIMLMSAEKPGTARGMYFDGVVLDEYAQFNPIIWTQDVRPALSDRLGWAIFIGTPEGRNHFKLLYDKATEEMLRGNNDWFTALYKASDTGIIAQSELEAARLTMSPEEYAQEYECSFSGALQAAYYGKQMAWLTENGRIIDVPFDRTALVSTYWDLGKNDQTAIWFMQKVGPEWHAIDYYEMSGQDIPHYKQIVDQKREEFGYSYDEFVLPHDAKAQFLGMKKTREEQFRDLKMKPTRVIPKQDRMDGINAVRSLLPTVWFDQSKCSRGIDCLNNYKRKWDGVNNVFMQEPVHNWASNGADAFRTLAMGHRNLLEITEDDMQQDCYYDLMGD